MIHDTPILTNVQRRLVLAYLTRLEARIEAADVAGKDATVERLTDLRDAIDIAFATCDAAKAGHPTQFSTADLNALRHVLPEVG
jgi:hypothetical protein